MHKLFIFFILKWWVFLSVYPTNIHNEKRIIPSDYFKMTNNRFIVDNAITISQFEALQEIISHEPVLNVEKPTFCIDCASKSKQAILPTSHFLQNISRYGISSHRETQVKQDVKSVEATVVAHVESFFDVKVAYHYSALVSRAQIDLEDSYDFSPLSINNRSGWVVKVHADICAFDTKSWKCPRFPDEAAAIFAYNHITAVLLLNELAPDAGGNLVFIDPLHLHSLHKSTGNIEGSGRRQQRQRRRGLDSNEAFPSNSTSIYDNYFQSYANKQQPSNTSHSGVPTVNITHRTADHHSLLPHFSDANNSTSSSDSRRFVRRLTVKQWEDGMPPVNYTLIRSRMRRLIVWNSSADNVHGVTQILGRGDHRYTFFMFMQVDKLHM